MIKSSSSLNEILSHQSTTLDYFTLVIAINLHYIPIHLFEKSSHNFSNPPTHYFTSCTFSYFSWTSRRDSLKVTKNPSKLIKKTSCLMYTQNSPPARNLARLILRDYRIMINPLFTSILIRVLELIFLMLDFLLPPHTHPWYNLRKTSEGRP